MKMTQQLLATVAALITGTSGRAPGPAVAMAGALLAEVEKQFPRCVECDHCNPASQLKCSYCSEFDAQHGKQSAPAEDPLRCGVGDASASTPQPHGDASASTPEPQT